MRILYIFPHPDDESFGPVAVMNQQLRKGHEVHLLTLTKGEATKQRFKLGISKEEMGEIRLKEMECVEHTLNLSSMKVLDFPDNVLKELDPRVLENVVYDYIKEIEPNIVVTYPIHGISGFHDHIVTHAVVKRVFVQMRDEGADYLKRLAFFTLMDEGSPLWTGEGFRLKKSDMEIIDCEIHLNEEDIEVMKKALSCYTTYKEVINKIGVVDKIGDRAYFELFQENFTTFLDDLCESLFNSQSQKL